MNKKNIFFWNTVNKFGTHSITFVGNILIARQLSPEDYGLIAMLAIIMGTASNFADSGFAECLIARKNVDKKDYSTVLTYNLLIGVVLFLIVFFTAPAIANFFERIELTNIARVLGVSIIFKALTLTELTRLAKQLRFKKLAIIHVSSNFIAVIIAYIMALSGFGYWALVCQTVLTGILNILLIIILNKWKPSFYFSIIRFKEMSGFSFNLLFAYLTNQFGVNFYSVLIGKYYSALSLGYYNQAQKLRNTPVNILHSIIIQTSFPLMAAETDQDKLYRMYKSLLSKYLFFHFSISAVLYISAYSIIEVLYGVKWIDSAPYFQLMLVAYLLYPIQSMNWNIAKVYNKGKLYRNLTFLKNGLLLLALAVTVKYSINTIIFGQIIASYSTAIISIFFCGTLIGFGFRKQFLTILNQIWKPLITMIGAYLISTKFEQPFFNLSAILISYTVLFILLNEITGDYLYLEFKNAIFSKINSLRDRFAKKSNK